jgi:GTP-binding protein YchF
MALSIGIAGLANVGKTTLFNALTKAQNVQAANYPFSTTEPNKATTPVPDIRVDSLSALVKPKKTTCATVDFIDIAGLVRGSSKGGGLGNQFLGNIRGCTAILEIVRCFEDENIPHVDSTINPLRDIETIETEFILADIQSVERRLERMQKQAKGDKGVRATVEDMNSLLKHLDSGQAASTFTPGNNEAFQSVWNELGLLSAKTVIYCANVDEDHLAENAEGNERLRGLRDFAAGRNAELVTICARLEEELQALPEAEQAEILASYGIRESGLAQVIRTSYRTLGLISFFTAGPKEVRAWTIRRGSKAPQAAGAIHSDLERGFIRAEIVAHEDYMRLGSEAACRAAGLLRVEGRDYALRDGDVAHFLFNV